MAFSHLHFGVDEYTASVEAWFSSNFSVDEYAAAVEGNFCIPFKWTVKKMVNMTPQGMNGIGSNALVTHTINNLATCMKPTGKQNFPTPRLFRGMVFGCEEITDNLTMKER
jgi:hypothetical protein